jgi:hypothetical protein
VVVNKNMGLMLASISLLCVILTVGMLYSRDAKQAKVDEQRALAIGLERAKQECQAEGLLDSVCGNLTTSIADTECEGRQCWIVYANTADRKEFFASVTVSKDNDTLSVTDYTRNKIQ